MKTFRRIMFVIILVLISLILFHTLNYYYPNNLIQRTMNGISLVLTPVLIAAVLVYLINPFTNWLIKKWKFSKTSAILFSIIVVFIAIALLIFFIVSFFIDQSRSLFQTIFSAEFIQTIKDWFINNNLESVYNYLEDFIINFNYQDLLGKTSSIISAIIQAITTIILVPIFLWHFMHNKEVIFDKINDNLPNNWKNHVIPVVEKSNTVVVSYFKSKIISIILLFIMFLIVYLILGMPIGYVILFAVLISILDLIPYLGPTIGLVIPIIYIFSIDGVNLFYNSNLHLNAITANIVLLVINFSIQLVQGNYIIPKLAGKQMNINPALILVFMLFFGSILGVWGIILSIPLGGIIIVIWTHLKEHGFLDDKPKK